MLIVSYGYEHPKPDGEHEFQKECEDNGLDGGIVPLLNIYPNKPGAYNSPRKCECNKRELGSDWLKLTLKNIRFIESPRPIILAMYAD